MRAPIKTIGTFLAVAFAGVLSLSSDARAASNPKKCTNDIDCAATPQCGGDVCSFDVAHYQTCQPAGMYGTKGQDGWCSQDSDCKCAAQGAKCNSVYCTFTLASDAPGGAGTGGASGATGGASGATGGASGATGGATGTGGSQSTGGASATGGSKESDSSGGGGCNVAGVAAAPGSAALLALLGLLLRRDRRRS